MQDYQETVDRKLNTLQQIIEAVVEKMNNVENLISHMSFNKADNSNEQSVRQFSRTTASGFNRHPNNTPMRVYPQKNEVIYENFEPNESEQIEGNRRGDNRPSFDKRGGINESQQDLNPRNETRVSPLNNPVQATQPLNQPNYPPPTYRVDNNPPPQPSGYPHPNPAPNVGPNYIQTYPHGYDPNHQLGRFNNWTGCICLMIWYGVPQLLGGIGMLIYGAILLSSYKQTYCPSSATRYGNQCCYYYNYYSNYNYSYCTYLATSSVSLTTGIVLLCVGFAGAIFGIILLCKAHKFYKDNQAPCC